MTPAPPPVPPATGRPRPAVDSREANASATDQFIAERIEESCTALWWAELIRHLLKLALASAAAIGIWVVLDHWLLARPSFAETDTLIRIVAFASFSVAAVIYLVAKVYPLIGHSISPEYAARSLERSNPELRQALTSFVTLRSQPTPTGLSQRVVQSIGSSTAKFLKEHDELPKEATGNMRLWVATAIALATLVVYAAVSPKNSLSSVRRLITPMANIGPATRVSIDNVTPGNVSVIAGRDVRVSADIKGLRQGESPSCEIDYAGGTQSYTLQRDDESLGNEFVAMVNVQPLASGSLPYRIVAGDATSPTFRFQVQDVPVVSLQSVAYDPPNYTAIAPFTRSTGTISAVDGTRITITASASRPVDRAAIEFNPRPAGDSVVATDGAIEMNVAADGTSLSVTFPLWIDRRRSATVRRDSYRIRVWDQDGVGNPDPIIYPINIIADLAPEVAIMLPTRVPKDVPIGTQQIIEVHASDADFGLRQIRLQMTSGIRTIGQPVLWRDDVGVRGNQVAEYRFRPGELGLSPGDVVQITAIATDNRVDAAGGLANDKNASSLDGNQTTTDPIELRIVETASMPPDPTADSEGLSEPDQQPAADPDGNQDGSEDGSTGQQSGGSGSSGSGSSGQGEPQEGGGGGGSQGEQSSEESSEVGQQGSGGGSSESPDGTQEQNQQGEGSSGDPQGQNDSPQNSPAGDSPASNSQAGDSPASDPAEANPGENSDTNGGNSNGNSGEARNASDPSASGQEASDPTGESNAGPAGRENGLENTGNDSPSDEAGQGETPGNASPRSDNPSEQPAEKPSGDPSEPAHDGEAFERIQDYLNQKKQQQENLPKSGQSSESRESSSSSESSSESPQGDSADSESSSGAPSSGEPTSAPESGSQSESTEASQGDSSSESSSESSSSDAKPSQSAQDSSSQDSQSPSDGKNGDGETGDVETSESTAGDQSTDGQTESGQQPQPGEQSQQGEQSQPSEQAQPGEQPTDPSDPSGEGSSGASSGSGMPSSQDDEAAQPKSPEMTPQSRPGSGEGVGEGSNDAAAGNPNPPQAANDQYAREATDMVLDYLDQTRDQPDPELLERLNWTEQDLRRFQDRWKDIRDLGGTDGAGDAKQNEATLEALRSLGLRPPSAGQNRKAADNADALKGIRDSGKRRRPPAAFRDAFDAFRRQMGSPN